MSQKFLSVKDVTFRYFEQAKRNILEHVDLDIEYGKITVILGNSGCGKSTLAAVCAGLYPENAGQLLSGSIQICGQELSSLTNSERAKMLTMMFQNPDLQFCMDTLRKEMIFCLENLCIPKEEMDEKIKVIARKLQIEDLLDRKLHTLSGGEKQKTVLCCLFLINPRGFFLDEPFANLDVDSAQEMVSMLKRQNEEYHTTIIAIDHRLDQWLTIADEFIILGENGQIQKRGISTNTLPQYKKFFLQEGLFYPESLPEYHPSELGETILSLEHVTIKKGNTKEYLLTEGNASFERGKMTALLGRSGCGKTTLLSAILKQKKFEGTILLEGTDIKNIRQKRLFHHIGTVFQNPANQFVSTQVQNEVEQSLKIWYHKMGEEERNKKALDLLEAYHLKQYRKYSPYMLSQGQQRRLAVLSILTGDQKILLIDEPAYGQDAKSTKAIMDQLIPLVNEHGLTVVFTTHDRFLAYKYADKIYCMVGKKLVEWRN